MPWYMKLLYKLTKNHGLRFEILVYALAGNVYMFRRPRKINVTGEAHSTPQSYSNPLPLKPSSNHVTGVSSV